MLRILILCLALCLTGTGSLAEALGRAEALIGAGEPARGLALLRDYRPATAAAEQRLLWALAIANMRLGQPAGALPHLERLVALAPRQTDYRLELAAALGQLGQNERALYHIEIARASGLPAPIDQRVADFAQRLENPRIVRGYISFAIAPESNPVKRTRATEVMLFGLPFQINPETRASAATGLEIHGGVSVLPPLTPALRGQLGLDLHLLFYNGRAPDDYYARLFAGLIHGRVETGQSRAQVFATRRAFDKEFYSRSIGLILGHTRRVSPATRLDGSVTHERLTYRFGATKQRNLLRGRVTHVINPQLDLSFGARVEQRRSERDSLAGRLMGVTLGGQARFIGGTQLGLTLDYERNRFPGEVPLFFVTRRDNKLSARVDIAHSQWNWGGFAPVLRLSYERQNSTVVINEFRNIGASIGVTRQF